jgi:hypothetical protein
MRNTFVLVLGATFLMSVVSHAEESKVRQEAKQAGKEIGTAAREIGQGTKKATKEVGKAVAEAARETGHAFRDGAKEVKKAVKGEGETEKKK